MDECSSSIRSPGGESTTATTIKEGMRVGENVDVVRKEKKAERRREGRKEGRKEMKREDSCINLYFM